jgi:hypothetical protein
VERLPDHRVIRLRDVIEAAEESGPCGGADQLGQHRPESVGGSGVNRVGLRDQQLGQPGEGPV